jgi:NMD protein affecting ribosome stability and mRNA decay
MKKKCRDCGKEFEVNPRARFERKYCDECSKSRKKEWEKIHEIKFEDCDE